jgi:hypothetical protein
VHADSSARGRELSIRDEEDCWCQTSWALHAHQAQAGAWIHSCIRYHLDLVTPQPPAHRQTHPTHSPLADTHTTDTWRAVHNIPSCTAQPPLTRPCSSLAQTRAHGCGPCLACECSQSWSAPIMCLVMAIVINVASPRPFVLQVTIAFWKAMT